MKTLESKTARKQKKLKDLEEKNKTTGNDLQLDSDGLQPNSKDLEDSEAKALATNSFLLLLVGHLFPIASCHY